MKDLIQKEFYNKLPNDKIKINWNKNPIQMYTFLSFLTIKVERSRDHAGSENGWTKVFNKEHDLIVTGGIIHGAEYLDTIQYGKNLHNRYNNYVNPFLIFGIMTEEGKAFFVDYYKDDIEKIAMKLEDNVLNLRMELTEAELLKKIIDKEIASLTQNQ